MTRLDLPKLSRRYQPTEQTWLTDWYLCTRFISWVFLSVPHLFYQIRNHFCDIFLKNQKNLQEMFMRRLRDVTERTSFLRYAPRVLKTSHKRHLFWELLRRLKDVTKKHLFWDVLRGLWDISLNGDLSEISQSMSCRLSLSLNTCYLLSKNKI